MSSVYGLLKRSRSPHARPAGAPASAPRRDGTPPRPRRDGSPLGEDTYTPDPSRQAPASDSPADEAKGTAGKTGETMMSKVGAKLADKAIFNEYGYRPPSVRFSQYGGIGFEMRVKPIKSDDGLIKDDPNRRRTTEKFAKEGKGITWTELRGAVTPSVGIPLWNPVGPVNVGVGFSASASLGLSVLFPVRHDVKEAVQNVSIKLPFDAGTALELTEGTELTVRGSGGVAIGAGTRFGDSWTPLRGPWSLGTSIGADSYVSKSMELAVRVKRLEGAKVFVSLSEVKTDANGTSASARAGVHGNIGTYVPETDNTYADKGRSLAVKAVSRQIERWLSLEARAVYSRSDSEREIKNYVLDLSKPEARRAYEALVKLDTRPADKLDAQGPDSGVSAVWLIENADVTAKEFQARLGPIGLIRSERRAEYAQGHLFTRQGNLDYDRATLDNKYQDIVTQLWKGKRETHRELVEARNGDGTNPHSYLQFRNQVKVGLSTPTSDVRRFVTLAKYLGVSTPDPAVLEKNAEFLSSFGRSERVVDFALTDKGLAKLLLASDDQLHAAFAAGYEELDQPWDTTRIFPWETSAWRRTPWLEKNHPRYAEIMRLLEEGPENSSQRDQGSTRDSDYYWITGRSLWQDSAAYKEAKDLVDIVGKLRRAGTPGERAKVLKSESSRLDVDCIRELAMLAKVAGRDGLKVQELWIKDLSEKKTYSFSTDGRVEDPRAVVDAWLNNPAVGPGKPAPAPVAAD